MLAPVGTPRPSAPLTELTLTLVRSLLSCPLPSCPEQCGWPAHRLLVAVGQESGHSLPGSSAGLRSGCQQGGAGGALAGRLCLLAVSSEGQPSAPGQSLQHGRSSSEPARRGDAHRQHSALRRQSHPGPGLGPCCGLEAVAGRPTLQGGPHKALETSALRCLPPQSPGSAVLSTQPASLVLHEARMPASSAWHGAQTALLAERGSEREASTLLWRTLGVCSFGATG